MTSVDIADVDAALARVRGFIALLEQNHAQWDAAGSGVVVGSNSAESARKQTAAQIQEQLPLIKRIAARADADLVVKMAPRHGAYSWSYNTTLEATRQLAGLLSSFEEEQRILGPRGPKLAAANLHQWVWNAAVSLWDDGHRREAVQAAAGLQGQVRPRGAQPVHPPARTPLTSNASSTTFT